MEPNKRVFISDVHMNAGLSIDHPADKYCYDWLGKAEANDFAAFLKALADYSDLKEIVFIGDLRGRW